MGYTELETGKYWKLCAGRGKDGLKKNMEEKTSTSLSQVKKQKKDLQRQKSKPRYLESQGV